MTDKSEIFSFKTWEVTAYMMDGQKFCSVGSAFITFLSVRLTNTLHANSLFSNFNPKKN